MFEFHAREKFNIKRITNGFSTHERTNNLFFDYIKRSVSFFKILLDQQGVEKQKLDIAANMLFEMILSTVSDYAVKKNAETAKIVLKQAVNGFVHSLVKSELQKPIAPTKVLKLKS
jgi:hypothetical protein